MNNQIQPKVKFALIILAIFYLYNHHSQYNKNQQISFIKLPEAPPENEEKVVIYSTDWCYYCKQAKNYFRKNHIKFTEYDIEKDKNARIRYKSMNVIGVPIIVVDNSEIMVGFNVNKFREIYP